MQEVINIPIQTSRTYLLLSVVIYSIGLFVIWYYFDVLLLNISLSVLLSIWLFDFLPKHIWLTHAKSVVKISLSDNKLIVTKNHGFTQQFLTFTPTYQSSFLIIINTGKTSIIIFKDSLAVQSLSHINRYFSANY